MINQILPSFIILSAVLAGFAYQIWFCYRPASIAKSVVKTTSIAMLALFAFLLNAPMFLIFGLSFCALGDLLLSRDTDRLFLFGLIAFAIGHVFYILLFLGDPIGDPRILIVMPWVLLGASMLAIGVIMAKVLWPVAGDLRVPVMIYITIIMAMGLSAISLNTNGVHIAFYGALIFIISDTILSAELFLLPKDHPIRRVSAMLVWAFYWLAQVTILFGIMAV